MFTAQSFAKFSFWLITVTFLATQVYLDFKNRINSLEDTIKTANTSVNVLTVENEKLVKRLDEIDTNFDSIVDELASNRKVRGEFNSRISLLETSKSSKR
jgi:regulator of replication initiation timing